MAFKFNPFTGKLDITGGGGGTPGGSDTQVQFNDSSAFGGDSAFTWNKTTNTLKVGTVILTGTSTVPSSPTAGELVFHTPTGRAVLLQYSGSAWIPIISIGAMTMYVDNTDGTDSQDKGTAVDSAAFKTIQYAINQIPGAVGGNVTININAETYAENVVIQGKNFTGNYTITLLGTRSSLDSLTSSASTQGVSGTQGTVVRGTGTWTSNQRQNKMVRFTAGVNSGVTRIIDSNDTTTLTIVGTWSGGAPGTDTFVVEDWGTIIQPASGQAMDIKPVQVGIVLTDLKMIGVGSNNGAYAEVTSAVVANTCYFSTLATVAGYNAIAVLGVLTLYYCVVTNASSGDRLVSVSGGPSSFVCYGSKLVAFDTTTNFGIVLVFGGYFGPYGGTIIEGGATGTGDGIWCTGNANGWLFTTTGDGFNRIKNWNNGIYAKSGSQVGATSTTYFMVFSGNSADKTADAASYAAITDL